MSEAKFTPGPWEHLGSEVIGAMGTDEAFVVCKLAFGSTSPAPVFSYLDREHRQHEPVVNANAALISAAPSLYAAAQALCDRHDERARRANFAGCGCEDCTPFRAVLKQAQGA